MIIKIIQEAIEFFEVIEKLHKKLSELFNFTDEERQKIVERWQELINKLNDGKLTKEDFIAFYEFILEVLKSMEN